MPDFCHLHCHTQYSLLDGAARIERLVKKAEDLEIPALAITDHGNLFGVPEFFTKAKKHNVQPIIGCEFYITPSGMQDRKDRTRYHQVLLAKNTEGYRNLIRLSSLSYTDGYYYKPRLDIETLRAHSKGLIATTCCLQGHVLQTILRKDEEAAREVFKIYLDIFGEDYYIELQDHGIPDQHKCNAILTKWATEFNVKVIATNDVHYVDQADAEAQDVLLCLQTGKDLHDPNRMRFENDQFYLKSKTDMQAAFPDLTAKLRDKALDTTREVADKCTFELPMGKLLMPHYPIPEAFSNDMNAYLKHLVFERAKNRYRPLTEDVVHRLNYELEIIKTMGYAGYFLIVQDFTTAAQHLGVRVGPGRGSAAGSAVAYCLGITNIEPLRYDLLFERFLNPERVSMPDIDIDFDDRGRSKVIDYVVEKYGRDNVCQIITFGTMGARSVIRDVSRVLGIPLPEADRIAKLIPEGPKENLSTAREKVPEFRALSKDNNPQIRRLMHYATVLEGSARHTGVHAAGVIIAPGRVSDYVPVSIAKGKGGNDDVMITQYDGKWIEEFGLLKMDFLGLKTLTILNDTLDLIKTKHGIEIDLDEIPLDDKKTYQMFQRGETVALFQFESSGMREWMRKLKPTSIDDLIAMNALYRPGPMDLIPNYIDRKHGREKVEYPHPMLEPILKPTYGIPVYQEQVMQMAQEMGSYTLGGADLLRRAMGKKKQKEMDKHRVIFVEGAGQKGVDEKTANEVFDMMAKFAGYGFNKSHSAAYSVVAYQTAYLKAHYPAEFMAAAMTSEMGDTKKLAVVLDEARKLGLEILPPSVKKSNAYFTVDNGAIRFGLAAIKGAGTAAIESLVKVWDQKGFNTLFQLTREIDFRTVNKKALDSLARAGAFDDLEGHRAQFVAALDDAIRYGQKHQADKAAGQNSLFGATGTNGSALEPNLPFVEPWTQSERLKQEKNLMGFYVSGHPLEAFAPEVRAFATAHFGHPDDCDLSRPQSFCGIITEVNRRTTKSGRPMAFFTLEDFTGQGEVICFSTQYEKFKTALNVDELVMVRGRVEERGGQLKIKPTDVMPMQKVRDQYIRSITLTINTATLELNALRELYALCDRNRGNCKLYFDVQDVELPNPIRLRSRSFVIDPSPELMQGITRLLGPDNIHLHRD